MQNKNPEKEIGIQNMNLKQDSGNGNLKQECTNKAQTNPTVLSFPDITAKLGIQI